MKGLTITEFIKCTGGYGDYLVKAGSVVIAHLNTMEQAAEFVKTVDAAYGIESKEEA